MEFQPITKEGVKALAPYLNISKLHFSDLSVGFQYMWNDYYAIDYAIFGDCLLLRETYRGKLYYHYPVSLSSSRESEFAAIGAIEEAARDQGGKLNFVNVPRFALPLLAERYDSYSVRNERKWRDYLYEASDFLSYPGKKFAGQRNHVHKFERLYPQAKFCRKQAGDEDRILAFLRDFESRQLEKRELLADEEMRATEGFVRRLDEFGQICGYMEIDGKIVSVTFGEVCGDMLAVHVEKANTNYEGIYPATAQAFVRLVVGERSEVRYVNREDDAGDLGLRKSKLQYNPVEIVDKFELSADSVLSGLTEIPTIGTPRLTLQKTQKKDAAAYFRLCSDVGRNRFWGYDYREDCPAPDEAYFLRFAEEAFGRREELYLGIYAGETFVGEAVLHRPGYRGQFEVGMRLLPEFEGNGYASEALRALIGFAFSELGAERAEAKCFLENERSAASLRLAGMREAKRDETHLYFYKTPAM